MTQAYAGILGTRNHRAKLTAEEVLEIRRKYCSKEATQQELAREYHVTQPTIHHILNRHTWRHLEPLSEEAELPECLHDFDVGNKGYSKLSPEQVTQIRERYASGESDQRTLAREFGVCQTHISAIVLGLCWKHLPMMPNNGHGTRGERNPRSTFTNGDVQAIRRKYLTGCISQTDLASEYGAHTSTISMILRRRTWSHLPLVQGEERIGSLLKRGRRIPQGD